MSFTTTDPKWQVNPQFWPNKESTWRFPPEDDGWALIHKCIRDDAEKIKDVLSSIQDRNKTGGIQEWELESIKIVIEAHFSTIHGHHKNEDEILAPELRTRFHYPEHLETDHQSLQYRVGIVEKKLTNLKPGDDVSSLQEAFVQYSECLLPHLSDEEAEGLPLMRAYFTPNEVKPITERIAKKSLKEDPYTIGMMVYYLGEKYFRKVFMKNHGVPFFVWWLVFQRLFKKYELDVSLHVEALYRGIPPITKNKCFF